MGWRARPQRFDVGFGTGNGSYRAVKVPAVRYDVDVLRANAGAP
jgi:hypothetical protein